MKRIVPSSSNAQHASLFEQIRLESEDGVEYWSARDLAKVLGYSKWEKFKNAIERAEIACGNSGQSVEEHFLHTTRVSTFGRGGQREIEDVHMSRYGCYLLVQNADPTKPAVAMGQTYFAVQTRRQEQTDQLAGLTEDQRRLYLVHESGDLKSDWRGAKQSLQMAKPRGIVPCPLTLVRQSSDILE